MPPPIYYVFEDSQVERLYPLTYSRPAFLLRCGAMTVLERMTRALPRPLSGVLVRQAVAGTVRNQVGSTLAVNPAVSTREGVLLINSRWLATGGATEWDDALPDGAGLVFGGGIAWAHLSPETAAKIDFSRVVEPRTLESVLPELRRTTSRATLLSRPWDLLTAQRAALLADFAEFGARNDATVMPGAHLINPAQIHLAVNVKVWHGAVLDAMNGPIIVESGSEIRANAVITGPVHIGKDCIIRTGADIRELCSFGPGTRVGGEVVHSIFLGNANKQHAGFMGQTLVGEWVNVGAGTTTSNLKNTYGNIRVPINGNEEDTGLGFMGSIIGDHAKLGIGTCLSTGSVVGFGSHVITPRPPKFVPSFAWVTDAGVARADFEKIEAIAKTAMTRRGSEFTAAEHEMFVAVASESATVEKFAWVTP